MKTLNLSSQTVNRIIEVYKEYIEKQNSEHYSSLSPTEKLRESIHDPKWGQLQETLKNLSLEERKEFSAIVWLGRGDYDSFESAYKHAQTIVDEEHGTVNYLEGKPLSEYVPRGIERLKKEEISLSNQED